MYHKYSVIVLQIGKTVVITAWAAPSEKWIKRQGYKFRGRVLNAGKIR